MVIETITFTITTSRQLYSQPVQSGKKEKKKDIGIWKEETKFTIPRQHDCILKLEVEVEGIKKLLELVGDFTKVTGLIVYLETHL